MMERIRPARIQEILNNGQRAHPRKDFEIEDEGVLHLEHNLQCAVRFDRAQKTMFLYRASTLAAARSVLNV